MTKAIAAGISVLMSASALYGQATAPQSTVRPPAVPLVANDPFLSIWSMSDELTGSPTRHWTEKNHRLTSLVRIDEMCYRLMGDAPSDLPAAKQVGLTVLPTRSIYEFEIDGVHLTLTFMTPLLPDDLVLMSRPVSYVTWTATSTQGNREIAVYIDAEAELAVNNPEQRVTLERGAAGDLATLRAGSVDQPVLGSRGDDHRIDWGYFYLAAKGGDAGIVRARAGRAAFAGGNELHVAAADEGRSQAVPAKDAAVMAMAFPLGSVGTEARSAYTILAYDDVFSVRYFNDDLKGYWTKDGATIDDLLQTAASEYDELVERCQRFDQELVADLHKVGGDSFVQLGVLAWRQALAAQKIVADPSGLPLSFSKENNSNGCMATVDVLYPASPQMIVFSPNLLKASLVPLLDYSASDRWQHPNAPHDLGTYPHATGQVYGGGDSNGGMPVEETGNMLCMLAALAHAEGNAEFSRKYWPLLTQWADYLKDKGLDPENQLTTDDFAGHIARNANLSAKAIMGIASYARLAEMLGHAEAAESYMNTARAYARKWMEMADNGDHYALVFGEKGEGTWSQKYNLVWDRLLELNVFPPEVVRKEVAYYLTKLNEFGLPLDSRATYTKLDWELWTAALAENEQDMRTIIDACARWVNTTESRVPTTDWYDTRSGRRNGFKARSVVGGIFMPLLREESIWKKYASRDGTALQGWAETDFARPEVRIVVAGADTEPAVWRYTISTPSGEWMAENYDDSSWQSGQSGFGTRGTPGASVNTRWDTNEIYLRRDFDISEGDIANARLYVHHDEDAEIYINGVLAARPRGFVAEYITMKISDAARQAMRPGLNTIAIRCRQTSGGQYIDAGLAEVIRGRNR